MDEPPQESGSTGSGAPAPLLVAAALVLLEGVALLVLAVLEVLSLDRARLTMGATVSVFFVAFAALLVLSGWGLARVRAWSRGPALLAQVIALGLAWNFRGGATAGVSVVLLVVGLVTLGSLLHPRSREALEAE